jgi:hypothetical protein
MLTCEAVKDTLLSRLLPPVIRQRTGQLNSPSTKHASPLQTTNALIAFGGIKAACYGGQVKHVTYIV